MSHNNESKNIQDDIPSVPVDNFKDQYMLVFDLTSMQDALSLSLSGIKWRTTEIGAIF